MKVLPVSRVWTMMAVALVTAGLLFIALYLGPRLAVPEPTPESSPAAVGPSLPPEADPAMSEVVARVDGYTITRSYLSGMVRLNKVLEALSGASALDERETLQRLVAWHVILQRASAENEPNDEQVQSYISTLQREWKVSEETMGERLLDGGVDRAFLEETIQRLLAVSAAVETLENEGHTLSQWLRERERAADIWIREDLVDAVGGDGEESAFLWTPTPTRASRTQVPEHAPTFTLERAGGGSFTLDEGLAKGPVVLVFFERCA